ncbi:MAG: hypothetical protein ACTSPQ_18385 [Candidatus Helarchaeota archaeon]
MVTIATQFISSEEVEKILSKVKKLNKSKYIRDAIINYYKQNGVKGYE